MITEWLMKPSVAFFLHVAKRTLDELFSMIRIESDHDPTWLVFSVSTKTGHDHITSAKGIFS